METSPSRKRKSGSNQERSKKMSVATRREKPSSKAFKTIDSCPWPSKCRRELVYQKLFEGNDESKIDGMSEVSAWKARSRIPLAIEVTTGLIHALMFDKGVLSSVGHVDGMDTLHRHSSAAILSLAIIRFVNLVTEVGQVSGYKIGVDSICDQMGVPEWIVDLRHSASHSTLPALSVLRTAAEWALQWVKIKWWQDEELLLSDVSGTPKVHDRERVFEFLCHVRDQLYGEIPIVVPAKVKGVKESKFKFIKPPPKDERALWNKILVDVLAHDGFLIPHARHFNKLLKKLDLVADASYSQSNMFEDSFRKSGDGRKRIFKALSNLWLPVIEDLILLELGFPLIEAMANQMTSESNIEAELAKLWLTMLLQNVKRSHKKRIDIDWVRICKQIIITFPYAEQPFQIARVLNLGQRKCDPDNLKWLRNLVDSQSARTRKLIQQAWMEYDRQEQEAVTKEPVRVREGGPQANRRFVPVSKEEIDLVWSKCPIGVLPEHMDNPQFNFDLPACVNRLHTPPTDAIPTRHFFDNRGNMTLADHVASSEEYVEPGLTRKTFSYLTLL